MQTTLLPLASVISTRLLERLLKTFLMGRGPNPVSTRSPCRNRQIGICPFGVVIRVFAGKHLWISSSTSMLKLINFVRTSAVLRFQLLPSLWASMATADW